MKSRISFVFDYKFQFCCLVPLLAGMPASSDIAFGQDVERAFPSAEVTAPHRGVREVELASDYADSEVEYFVQVAFTRPDSSVVKVDAFRAGDDTWRARAYCDTVGEWTWRTVSTSPGHSEQSGSFHVEPSNLPGKLRQHPRDRRQFARDDGSWFLHLGDTGYRFVVASEPHWQAYIDQAAEAGFTKVRTWFAQSRGGVEALLTDDRTGLNLSYWEEIDKRLRYALDHYPHVEFQLIPYAEDTQELRRYTAGDPMSRRIGVEAQARWSSFPNVHWALSNDRQLVRGGELSGRKVTRQSIEMIGRDFREREPWGTLLTNHQSRSSGYDYVDAEWSDITTLEDLDQVDGSLILKYRELGDDPVVNDEDRYSNYRSPANRRYFFRRLMWASLLSGGHATYGGLNTFEPFDDTGRRGVRGYFDANREGVLYQGAHDFRHIQSFFRESGLTLVGMQPDDQLVGGIPAQLKCIRGETAIIVYLANPSGANPGTDNPAAETPTVELSVPQGRWRVRWFQPRLGNWIQEAAASTGGEVQIFQAPHRDRNPAGDWVLLLERARA